MIKEAIEKIQEMCINQTLSTPELIGGRQYIKGTKGYIDVLPPRAETMKINTLTGIVDYDPDQTRLMVHVVDHLSVHVKDKEYVDAWLTRSTHLVAVHESPVFKFGQFMGVEDFIISLQSMFVQDDSTALILKVVGNVKDEGVTQFTDDGITQAVTAKSGISRVEQVAVPNPVTLRPYRTFMEIEQPASTFVLRMKGEKGFPPSCALFEADGRMWRLEAIKSIRQWLAEKIPGIKIIA